MQANEWGALIDKLAAKLAVPASQLWDVLTRQGQIVAVTNLLWATLWLGAAVLIWRGRAGVVAWAKDKDDPDFIFLLYTVVARWMLGGVLAAAGVACISSVVEYAANPQYFALSQILEALK